MFRGKISSDKDEMKLTRRFFFSGFDRSPSIQNLSALDTALRWKRPLACLFRVEALLHSIDP